MGETYTWLTVMRITLMFWAYPPLQASNSVSFGSCHQGFRQ